MTDAASTETYKPFAPFSEWVSAEVGAAWVDFLDALNAEREAATPADLETALDLALRSAALETGAIEGLYATTRGITRTVALQGAMWEAELKKLGSEVRGHFEAQLSAFELALDAVTGKLPVSEAWLRELHAKVCAAQATYTTWSEAGRSSRSRTAGTRGRLTTSRFTTGQPTGTPNLTMSRLRCTGSSQRSSQTASAARIP